MKQVVHAPSVEIVDRHDRVAAAEEQVAQVRAQKPGAAGHADREWLTGQIQGELPDERGFGGCYGVKSHE
jgi:hypothetical protein